jgi:hypothetical protein
VSRFTSRLTGDEAQRFIDQALEAHRHRVADRCGSRSVLLIARAELVLPAKNGERKSGSGSMLH